MNPLLKPEEFTRETAAAFTTRIEEALQERGLLLHQAGHGWTGDVLGFPCADWKAASEPLPPETAPLAACINGKRELFHGVPMNTNLCYSNETVIEKFSDRVVEYCIQHPAISCVHVWLADEFNNICECEACRTQLPTDQYIRILNRIDEKLTGLHLDTKIVFLLYQELLWPPVKEAFRNPDRFLLMFAPISRTFEHSYQLKDTYGPAPAYERNRITLPVGLDENMVFLKSWQNCFHGEGFVYDYPLGRAHYGDFGYIHIAEIIGQDIRKLKQMGLDGYISCQELRVCLPNAFPAYVMGRMLFDADVTFGELKEEYFRAAYGPGWEQVLSYLTKLSSLCSCDYFNGKEDRKDPREAAAMKELIRLAEHAPLPGQEGTDSLTDAQNLFWKYLDYHREYSLRLGKALMKLAEEDPTFKTYTDEETGQTIIAGMGELHLEIIVDRLLREFKVEANVGAPQVAYKETVKGKADVDMKYARQSGGKGQYGHVKIKLEPNESGKGYEFINAIVGGAIPKEYIPAVDAGIQGAMQAGVLAGYPVVDVKVTLYDGSYHEVDSSEMAFKIAGSMAFKEACRKAQPVILEPIMKVSVIVPEEYMGDVIGDISARRGNILGMIPRNGSTQVDANVPLSQMFGYATDLRSRTQGRGQYSMEPSHYVELPKSIQQEIVEKRSSK